jgi:predicted RNase H-like HicB family nuclease
VAEVPELAGCMAHGESQESALANVNDAVALWIATANELGRAVPRPS